MLLRITALADNDRDAGYIEPALNVLHEMNARREPIQLEYGTYDGELALFCRVPLSLKNLVINQLADAYPSCRIEQITDYALDEPQDFRVQSTQLRLAPDVFPLKRHEEFGDYLTRTLRDPVGGFFSALRTGKGGQIQARIIVAIRPATDHRTRQARRILRVLKRRFICERLHDAYERMATHPSPCYRLVAWFISFSTWPDNRDIQDGEGKLKEHLFETCISCQVASPPTAKVKANAKLIELIGTFGSFSSRRSCFRIVRLRVGPSQRYRGSLLSVTELATLWHPATGIVTAERQTVARYRELEPPLDLPSKEKERGVTMLGRMQYRNRRNTFGLRLDDRRRHVYIVGKSGMGKSTLLASMALSDIVEGHGVCFIDPHGDIFGEILDRIPKRRTNDVIAFDPSDAVRPVGFDPLCVWRGNNPERVADGVVSAFIKVFKLDQAITTRLLHILRNSVLILVENPGSTLIGLQRLLVDDPYRQQLLRRVTNPAVRRFWNDEFDAWPDRLRTEYIASLQNKLGAFLTNQTLQHVLGQSNTKLNLRSVMDEQKILLVNLSKGTLGEEGSHVLGALLTAQLQGAAMSRVDMLEEQRPDFMLYVDEFQHFATDTFASILSEARKFRLSLTVANQYLAQLSEDRGTAIRDAVFGNVGSMVCFQVGPEDAELLAMQLGSAVSAADLLNLPNYHAYVRLLLDGMPQHPFVMTTTKPTATTKRGDTICSVSRRQYGRPLEQVKADVQQAFGVEQS